MIIIHILIALAAIVISTINTINPKSKNLKLSYGLAATTLATGVSLIFLNNASIMRTCVTGLVFFAAVTALNELARKKLTLAEVKEQ